MNDSGVCLANYTITHTILRDKKYFSNWTLSPSNVKNISLPIDFIKGSRRATIILPNGTKFQIIDTLYSDASSRNLLGFEDIHWNRYHIETMNHDGIEYLLITCIIYGGKQILEPNFLIEWFDHTIIKLIELYVVIN